MRVGIIGLMHESNTFIAAPTTLADYQQQTLAEGEKVREIMSARPHEVGGYFEGLASEGIDAVPIMMGWANPTGAITADTFDALLALMTKGLKAAGKLDGLLLAPHGAAVCEKERDMDGYWMSHVREMVGPDMPIIATCDPHVNLSQRMVDAVDAIISYRSNPHLDQRQRGLEAARLMASTLRGDVKPVVRAAMPPIAINIERQFTDDPPCKPLYDLANAQLTLPGVLSNSVMLGFPYADVAEMGSAFTVVTDNDPALAQKLADELSRYLVEHRQEFVAHLIGIEEAIDRASKLKGPVCLLDMGDNVGGGSTADGTYIANAIHKRGGPATFTCIFDIEAQQQARDAGEGAKLTLTFGGKTDDRHGAPITANATVRSLHDGTFEESRPRHGGLTHFDMGPTAIIETDTGLTVQLTSRRVFPTSLNQLLSCDVDPKQFNLIIAKGVNAPVAAYREVCDHFIRVNTPGSTSADMSHFTYQHRRRPLFPFEEIA